MKKIYGVAAVVCGLVLTTTLVGMDDKTKASRLDYDTFEELFDAFETKFTDVNEDFHASVAFGDMKRSVNKAKDIATKLIFLKDFNRLYGVDFNDEMQRFEACHLSQKQATITSHNTGRAPVLQQPIPAPAPQTATQQAAAPAPIDDLINRIEKIFLDQPDMMIDHIEGGRFDKRKKKAEEAQTVQEKLEILNEMATVHSLGERARTAIQNFRAAHMPQPAPTQLPAASTNSHTTADDAPTPSTQRFFKSPLVIAGVVTGLAAILSVYILKRKAANDKKVHEDQHEKLEIAD